MGFKVNCTLIFLFVKEKKNLVWKELLFVNRVSTWTLVSLKVFLPTRLFHRARLLILKNFTILHGYSILHNYFMNWSSTELISIFTIFPLCSNAWPPLQEIIVTGLENTGDAKALDIAKKLVEKWLRNVYVSYVQSEKKMFEKYDVEEVRKRSF